MAAKGTTKQLTLEPGDIPASSLPPDFLEVQQTAALLLHVRKQRAKLEDEEDRIAETLIPMMIAKQLHGVVFPEGVVRHQQRTTYGTIEPAKLRAALSDAPNYIKEVVDGTALAKDYPRVAMELGKKRTTDFVAVYLK
jgi:hypothetical protein